MIQPVTARAATLTAAAAAERTLPVGELLAPVLSGLQRGITLACCGDAPAGLALAAVAGASRAGTWVAVAGQPTLGLQAAAEAGVVLSRLVAVHPGAGNHYDDARWGELLAAMIDGFDIVIAGTATASIRPGTGRRLQARAKARGAVLVTIGQHPSFTSDIRLDAAVVRWTGLGDGHGLAHTRTLAVVLHGRRQPQPRRFTLAYPTVALPFTPDEVEVLEVAAVTAAPTADRRSA